MREKVRREKKRQESTLRLNVGEKGQASAQGQFVLAPQRGDHLNVNGIELFRDSALATLREVCALYKILAWFQEDLLQESLGTSEPP